jgi:cell wall-associated NlpC family hydrolase
MHFQNKFRLRQCCQLFVIIFAGAIAFAPITKGGTSAVVYKQPQKMPPLLAAAMSMVTRPGLKYVFGANSPDTGEYDCSSFVQNAAREAGLANLPRSSRAQFALMRKSGKVWTAESAKAPRLKPGDLIFFSGTFPHRHSCPVSHVMIYAGQGLMIGAQPSGVGYFKFDPSSPPKGFPGRDDASLRSTETVYAYARPSWSSAQRILLAHSHIFGAIK